MSRKPIDKHYVFHNGFQSNKRKPLHFFCLISIVSSKEKNIKSFAKLLQKRKK